MSPRPVAPTAPRGLRALALVARRELHAAFDSSVVYVAVIGFVLLANSIFMNEFFLSGQAEMGPWFRELPLLLVFFVPATTMRLWAEERKQRTFEVLVTLPLRPVDLVLGKFVAALGILALQIAGSLPIVLMLFVLGDPELGVLLTSYLGAMALGAVLTSLGLLLSARTSDQLVSFVLAVLGGSILVLCGHPRAVAVLDGLAGDLALGTRLRESLSVLPPYESLLRGALRIDTLALLGGMTVVFLALNTLAVSRAERS